MKPLPARSGSTPGTPVTLEDQVRAIVCLRCGKQEIPDANVAIRLGLEPAHPRVTNDLLPDPVEVPSGLTRCGP